MKRHVCIHGHFYQPPRENPWLEEVELQDSAHPFHDWNEKINAECYSHNSASRIVDGEDRILNIVNNYSRISFNFGPTLLSWLEKNDPRTYQKIIEADIESRERFSGHGSALAQAYNHMIMPLANSRDKRTQVIWGIRDFEHRFGRKPEGMWLPETAVDLETLVIMADQGIRFTILAPRQAHRVRKIGDKSWKDVSGDKIDPKLPYQCQLPAGKKMALFFYDGPVSQGIAFENLLKSGEDFANRLMSTFVEDGKEDQLVHIATDGETYGHHHKWGDMALVYCLHHIESHDLATITIYGEYLEKHPPQHEVEIFENSSWSCVHGVERWKSDCGCCSGMNPGWNQKWRATLRGAMDWLRDSLTDVYQKGMSPYIKDPWLARDDYVDVLLNRNPETIGQFLAENQARDLSPADRAQVLKFLEMQRHAMLMYTSCGWFFDDISGIETVQIIRYAARAMQLAKETTGVDLEPAYVEILARAQSNVPRVSNAATVYEELVRPVALDLLRIGAHYAISSLFKWYPEKLKIFCFTAESSHYKQLEMGPQKLAFGKVHIRSDVTLEEAYLSFAVLHLGEQNFIGGGKYYDENDSWEETHEKIQNDFLKGDLSSVITTIDHYYESHDFGLWHLFHDEQRSVMERIMTKTLAAIEPDFRKIYDSYLPLMLAMQNLHIPLPKIFLSTVEFILNSDLAKVLEDDGIDLERLTKAFAEFTRCPGEIDKSNLSFLVSRKITDLMSHLKNARGTESLALLLDIEAVFKSLEKIEVELDLWKAQNIYFSITNNHLFSDMKTRAEQGESEASAWIEKFLPLGERLKLRIN